MTNIEQKNNRKLPIKKKTNTFVSFLKLIRFENLLIIFATQYLFRYFVFNSLFLDANKQLIDYFSKNGRIAPFNFGLQLLPLDFFLLSLSTVMIAAAGYIINDYFDLKTDRINRPTSIIIDNGIKRRVAMLAHLIINCIGILIGFYIGYKVGNYKLGMIHVFAAGLLWFYSTNFKKIFFLGNLIVAFLTGLVPLVVAIFETHLLNHRSQITFILEPVYKEFISIWEISFNRPIYFAAGFASFAVLCSLMREIVKDMKGFIGDLETGGQSIPIKLGYTNTKTIVQTINLFTISLLLYVGWYFLKTYNDSISIIYIVLTLVLPLIVFSFVLIKSNSSKKFNQSIIFLNFVMLFGILYSLIIWYNCSRV